MYINSILFIILAIYCSNKKINVITHVSMILTTLNLVLFLISSTSIVKEIDLNNLLPFLKTDQSNIIVSAIKLSIINILPLIIILIIPKNKITNQKKYQKFIIISYIIGAFISTIITIYTISTLSIYLVNVFEFPEYMVLKRIKLFGFLERVENLISLQWITYSFIYITIIIYTISKSITNNQKQFTYSNIVIGILLIISQTIFKNNTSFNDYISSSFMYIISILIPIYIIIIIKIRTKKELKSL